MLRRYAGPGMHGVGGIALADLASFGGGAAVATPYSLSYDGTNDYVDFGTPATLDDLFAGPATIDVYYRVPAVIDDLHHVFASQGDGDDGFFIGVLYTAATPRADFFLRNWDVGGVQRTAFKIKNPVSLSTWYYLRGRKAADTKLYLSANAGGEASSAAVATYQTATRRFLHGDYDGGAGPPNYPLMGNICYIHAWNVDKGALGAVPTSPFAVDANTVGRWIHSEGAGVSLGDTSGNANNGTIAGATWSATVPAGWTI